MRPLIEFYVSVFVLFVLPAFVIAWMALDEAFGLSAGLRRIPYLVAKFTCWAVGVIIACDIIRQSIWGTR